MNLDDRSPMPSAMRASDVVGDVALADVQSSPVKIVLDRMHGRWLWAIIAGAVVAPALAGIGYAFGPVKYDATAVLAVEGRLDPLVAPTLETADIKVDQAVAEQAQLLRDPQVLYKAFADPELSKWEPMRPGYRESVAAELRVSTPRGAGLFLVSLTDGDARFSSDAVNAVVRAYLEIFAPNTEIEYQQKVDRIQQPAHLENAGAGAGSSRRGGGSMSLSGSESTCFRTVSTPSLMLVPSSTRTSSEFGNSKRLSRLSMFS